MRGNLIISTSTATFQAAYFLVGSKFVSKDPFQCFPSSKREAMIHKRCGLLPKKQQKKLHDFADHAHNYED